MVHYNDLKADLSGEMKRVADFLEIKPPHSLWPELVEAATFDSMKRNGGAILAGLDHLFEGGHQSFLHRGTNDRWREVLTDDDVRLYHERVNAELSAALSRWLEHGRLRAGELRSAPE